MATNIEIIKKACEGSAYWRVEGIPSLTQILDEARADERAKVQSGKLTEVGQSLYDRRKHIEAHTAKQLDALLDEMETRADFFYKDATDLANKNYERGFFDGIHNARAKIKEALENKAIK